MEEAQNTKNLKMRPRARLISLLGDELISDEKVAVVELVKNAYDADAKTVSINFELNHLFQPERIIIKDDGHGMDLDTIIHGWFEPGTVFKKNKDRSPENRLYQGAKGVGRFAAARLGSSIFIETKMEDKDQVTVLLEWGNFNDESYLDQIEITYETSNASNISKGTTLTIEGLADKKKWEEEDFKSLQYRLSRLISPFQEISDFKITLEIPNYPELSGDIEAHPLTKKPRYYFKGELSTDGLLNAVLDIENKNHKEFVDHKISDKNEEVKCGGFSFEIRAWDRDRDGLGSAMLEYDMNLSTVRKTIDSYCGVSIYRDGFRVHPYGEIGDDWLTLDNRSRQNPTKHLAKNQIISSIKISRETNPELKDRTTREGLVHTVEFEQLQTWFKKILSTLEEERYLLRPREGAKAEYVTTMFEVFDMSDVVNIAHKKLGNDHEVTKLVVEKDLTIREGVKRLQDHYSRVLLAAGLGQLVDLVIHEIGAPLGRINREILFIKRKMKEYLPEKDQIDEMDASLISISGWLEQIGNLRSRLDPKTAGKRGRQTSFNVEEEVIGNLNLYENLIAKQKIQVSLKSPKNPIVVHMPRSNLGQIVANLIDNSVYWLTRHHGDGNGGKIIIEISKLQNGFKIVFCDDGPGVSDAQKEVIFEQYFSKKENGMGLGLFIARQVIEPYGKLIYRDDCELSGAGFEAIFEQKVGL